MTPATIPGSSAQRDRRRGYQAMEWGPLSKVTPEGARRAGWKLPAQAKDNNPMKKYKMSFAESLKHVPEHPERTARRSLEWDVQYQVWPNRQSMARSIRMQEKREPRRGDWKAVVPLGVTEGYGLGPGKTTNPTKARLMR